MIAYYVLTIWKGVEPAVSGSYDSDADRDQKAREIHKQESDDTGIFRLDVDLSNFEVSVDSYSGGFFEEESEVDLP